jgi:FkbM family methyltransferase
MTPEQLGALWALPLHHKQTLGRASEAMIERVYRLWLRPGDIAVDVGANVGRHLFPLIEAVGPAGRIFAFEPIPELAEKLTARLEADGLQDRVTLRQMAVSDAAGASEFHHNLAAPAMSGLKVRGGLPDNSEERVLKVETGTLDGLLAGIAPNFIKIDVEGAEFQVLRGAAGIMRSHRPLVVFEDGRGGSAALNGYTMAEFYDHFGTVGYTVLDIFGYPVTNEMSRYGGPWNFYAVPDERMAEARDAISYGMLYELWELMPV